MNLKTCILGLSALFIFSIAKAQDHIYKRNGDVIAGKVTEIGTKTISYKKANNTSGPNYVIDKMQVEKIEYENGTVETVSDEFRRPGMGMGANIGASNKNYGNNVLALSPLQITDRGVGILVSYERVLDKRNLLSFYMPVAIALTDFNNSNNNPSGSDNHNKSYYFMPGLKFYPTGGKGLIRYGLGINLAYVTGREDNYITVQTGTGSYNQWVTDDFYKFGMMISNSLNINPTEHLHLGLELSFGFSYLDNRNEGFDPSNDGPFNLAQFGFQIGYRF